MLDCRFGLTGCIHPDTRVTAVKRQNDRGRAKIILQNPLHDGLIYEHKQGIVSEAACNMRSKLADEY
jgi:hypothetical protein